MVVFKIATGIKNRNGEASRLTVSTFTVLNKKKKCVKVSCFITL